MNTSSLVNLITNIVRSELLRFKFGAGASPTQPASPSGTAGGDLSGTYPNPEVSKIRGLLVFAGSAPNDGDVLKWSAASEYWYPTPP